MSDFLTDFTPGITPVELEYFTIVISTMSDKWIVSLYYNNQKVKYKTGENAGQNFEIEATTDAINAMKNAENLYAFLNTNVDNTKKMGTLESGFDNVLLQTRNSIPEPSTYALILGASGFLFVMARRLKK